MSVSRKQDSRDRVLGDDNFDRDQLACPESVGPDPFRVPLQVEARHLLLDGEGSPSSFVNVWLISSSHGGC